MQHLGTVIDVFLGLEPHFQEVIADITQRIGEGMAKFIQRDVSACSKGFSGSGFRQGIEYVCSAAVEVA
jgi:hypothetical protein